MDDLIRRSDAIKALEKKIVEDTIIYQKKIPNTEEVSLLASEIFTDIPAVEPKQGEWEIIKIEPYNFKFRCKECGWYEHHAYEDVKPYNFCPNCGARMFAKDINVPNKEGIDDK